MAFWRFFSAAAGSLLVDRGHVLVAVTGRGGDLV